ncbi:MAG: hypothetical protein OEU92_24175 [Alphaproteobacteria bacterium]|nr:hypothetical protein [Alphaproteobacteria bacterium]
MTTTSCIKAGFHPHRQCNGKSGDRKRKGVELGQPNENPANQEKDDGAVLDPRDPTPLLLTQDVVIASGQTDQNPATKTDGSQKDRRADQAVGVGALNKGRPVH